MEELLSKFSLAEIILFICLLAVSFKKVADFFSWYKERMKIWVERDEETEKVQQRLQVEVEKQEKLTETVEGLASKVGDLTEVIQTNTSRVDMIQEDLKNLDEKITSVQETSERLQESEKETIKDFINTKSKEGKLKGWINEYDLNLCERRYEMFKSYGGDDGLLERFIREIRNLPTEPPQTPQQKEDMNLSK
jgi:peptidoglycan hydrolase CwlO-like protein